MTENDNEIKCQCGSTNIKKNGKHNGRQRYLCKDCGKTFYYPHEYKYQHNTKRILSLLYKMLYNDLFKAEDLEEALYDTRPYYQYACNTLFCKKYLERSKNKRNLKIECYKPKLLICKDDKYITFIPIPSDDDISKITIETNSSYAAKSGLSRMSKHVPLIKEKKEEDKKNQK